MKSLKQEQEELADYGFWTPQYGSFLRKETDLRNKDFSFIDFNYLCGFNNPLFFTARKDKKHIIPSE